jgi:hypothetical protein
VPIILTSLGNERQVNGSLTYNSSILSSPQITCGPAAPGCTIVQTNGAGSVGFAVTLAAPLAAGERQILTATFNTLSGGQANTPVLFGDSPTPRLTTDVAGNPLATSYTGGFVIFTAQGLEGDLQTRFTGDGVYRSNDVEQQRRFVSGLDGVNTVTNEFERADVAPYATKGDGRLRADDFQLSQNYVAVLVAAQTAGGPDEAVAGPAPLEERDASKDAGRAMRIVGGTVANGKATVTVEMDSLGDETVALFTLNFDPAVLSNPAVSLGDTMAEGTHLTANTRKASEGKVTVLLDSATPFAARTATRIVTVTFDVAKDAPIGDTSVVFGESGSFSDAAARSLGATYTDGRINVKGRSLISRLFDEGPFTFFGLIGR